MEYLVQVTDANGCQQWNSKLMTEPVRDDWTMNGNAGSNPNTQYIGTSDQTDFVFRTNSTERLRIKANGELKISSLSGSGDAIILTDENGVMTRWGISIAPLPNCPDPATFAWQHRQAPPNSVYTCWERVGINTSYPLENLQIGDQFTFHSGGSKVISFNSYYDAGTQTRKRILGTAPVSVLNFHSNGSIEFATAPEDQSNPPANYADITTESRLFIGNDGSVGIGTANPATRLDVNGNLIIRGKFMGAASNSWTTAGWQVPFVTTLGSAWRTAEPLSNGLYLGFGMATSGWFWIMSGNTGNTGTPFYPMALFVDPGQPNGIRLQVCGAVYSKRLRIETNGWCDYVFNKEHQRMSISEKETFYKVHKHLPSLPPQSEIITDGIDLETVTKGILVEVEETRLDITEVYNLLNSLKTETYNLRQELEQLKNELKNSYKK